MLSLHVAFLCVTKFLIFCSQYGLSPALMETHPMVDYTDESYIELVFTDIGALTPPEVCDELFKLYI